MLVQIVRYRTGLTDDEVRETLEARATDYTSVPGLVQKYYLSYAEPGVHGGVYLWASRESFEGFRATDLARSIPVAYRVVGAPEVELAGVAKVLYPRCAVA